MPIYFFFFFVSPDSCDWRFGRVNRGSSEVQRTQGSTFLPQRGDSTVVIVADNTAKTVCCPRGLRVKGVSQIPSVVYGDVIRRYTPIMNRVLIPGIC